jgi:hypothetical protein
MSFTPLTTGGLSSGGNFTTLISGGTPANPLDPLSPPSSPNYPLSSVSTVPAGLSTDPTVVALLQNPSIVRDVNGNPVNPSPTTSIDMGQGQILQFDAGTLNARMQPVVNPTTGSGISVFSDSDAAFSGSSCKILIDIPQTPNFNGSSVQGHLGKQLIEATAITISTHRAKTQVRPFGYINPKGIARGSRTIAGTLILNRFTADVLYRFLQSGLMADLSKDTHYNKLDQLPPFNITLMFSNEQGYISTQSLYGVEFVTDGQVASVQDILLEQTITYFATDMSPLVPLNFNTMFQPSTQQTASTGSQRTVSSLWKSS